MKLGIRAKLVAISVLLVVSTVAVAGIYFERQVRVWTQNRVEAELSAQAAVACELVRVAERERTELSATTEKISSRLDARVTAIGPDGGVLGDSEQDPTKMDNHARRPEVVAAHDGAADYGVAVRFSETIGVHMLYVARPCAIGGGEGTLRVSQRFSDLEEAVRNLRLVFFFAGLSGIALALIVSLFAARMMSRAFSVIVDDARRVAESGGGKMAVVNDEFGGLAGSFNRLAGKLERTVDTLARERGRFEAILEGLADGVFAVDGERQVTMINGAARELFNVRRKSIGRELVDVIRIPAIHELVTAGLAGEEGTREFEVIGPPRRRVIARAARPPGATGVVIAVQDVTELRRLENMRRDFVTNVSHELRTPVAIVRANAETLIDGALDQPDIARRFLDAQLRAADRLANLVNDLLEISRIESGRYQRDPEWVKIDPIARRVMDAVDELAVKKNIELIREVPSDLVIWGDARALDHVLLNLVENAVKSSYEGGRVQLRAKFVEDEGDETQSHVRVEVEDNGPGIEAIHRPRVFERFYRVDPGRSRSVGGTGLGLAIVKHLVEVMGGAVGVDPVIPRGSCFWVTLPVRAGEE